MELSYDYKSDKLVKRSKTIFSVLASSNRVDILKILSTKGALTYSELKMHTGFKSKKESGKFAYHLRKLLKYSLIASNKGEKKYIITNRGRDILNLVKQIEERSMIESGKIYVKTYDGFYELSTHKIAQILIRDGLIPPDTANKIAEEVESKIARYEISYLTHSLMLEILNSTLIENGYEEFRARLARLGVYHYELTKLLSSGVRIEDLASNILSNIFAEYVLFYNLPKDLVDQHIEGNIHIPTSNLSTILPHTIFIDADNLKPYSLIKLIQDLSSEVSREVVINNPRLELDSSNIASIFSLINCNRLISFRTDDPSIIEGYREYLGEGVASRIGLIVEPDKIEVNTLIDILKHGGLVAVSREVRSMSGIKRGEADIIIHAISVNLPRIAYESNNDEEYFRARLAMIIRSIIDATSSKREIVSRFMDDARLSSLRGINKITKSIINLVAPYTAIDHVLGYDDVLEVMEKSIDTARDSMKEDDGLVIIEDDSVSRLASLDLERYGKIVDKKYEPYLMIEDDIDAYNAIDSKLDGLSLVLDMSNREIIDDAFDRLGFFIARI